MVASSHAGQVDVSNWTLRNHEGSFQGFTFELLKSSHNDVEHSATTVARAKLRHWHGPLDTAVPSRDLVLQRVLLPRAASDLFLSADMLWAAADEQQTWDRVSHLAVLITLWDQNRTSFQHFIRQGAEFAQVQLADGHGVGVHLIAHDPRRIGHGADPHVHLVCTARQVTSAGLGAFAHAILHNGCQTRVKSAWDAWRVAHP